MPFKAIFIFFNSKSQDYNNNRRSIHMKYCSKEFHCHQHTLFLQEKLILLV